MMKKLLNTLNITLLLIFLSSCCACRQGTPRIGALESSTWQLIELFGENVVDYPIILTFDAKQKMIYGDAPCNNFFASYSIFKGKKNNVKFLNAGVTRKFCPDTEVEDTFTQELESIVTLQVEQDNILMFNSSDILIGILQKQESI